MTVSGSDLKIGDAQAASWKDETSQSCKVEITFTPAGGSSKTITSGDKIAEAGKLTVKVTDDAGNSSSKEISLISVAVTGLEALKDSGFQVDSKTSLLEGVTITEGLTLVKTEITSGTTGETVTIEDPANFIPELPGTASLTLTLSRPDGTLITETLEGLTIRPLVYSTPTFETADYINEDYSWFNVLSRKTKAFIRLHLLTSYINAEWFRKENMVYIMIGEVPASFECEDIADS